MTEPIPLLGRGELQRRAVRGALWTGVHTLISLPVAFLVNVLVARILDVEGYGRLTYLSTVIALISGIAGMGVTTALIQFGSKAHAAGRSDEVRRLLSGSQGFRLLVSGPVTAFAVFAIVQVDWWLMAIALMFGVGAPAFLGGANPALTIENRTDRTAQLTIIGTIVTQLAVVLTVLSLGTADAVWSSRVIITGVMLALPLIAISHRYRYAILRPAAPWRLPREFWAFALPTGAAGILGALVGNRSEVVLLDWFSDEYAMGLFGLAFGLAGHVFAPAQAFMGPLVPAISGLSEVEPRAVRGAFLRATRVGATIGGLLVSSALPAFALLVPSIYGDRFAPAADMLVALGLSGALVLVGSPHMAFLMARLSGRRILWINIVSLVVNLALAIGLIPFFGAWGAVVACAFGMVVRTTMITLGEARAWEISFRELSRSLGGMFVAIPITLLLWVGGGLVPLEPLMQALFVGILGMALFVVSVRLTRAGFTDGDIAAVEGALSAPLLRVAGPVLRLLHGGKRR